MPEIKFILTEKMNKIEDILVKSLPLKEEPSQVVVEAMHYSLLAGGKRIRPIFMEEAYKICHGKGSCIYGFMAAIEMIHTYSLIHDDLPAMDNDDLRRGKPTCHISFGEDIAILAGDALLNRAFELVLEEAVTLPEPQVMEAMKELFYASGTNGMIGGQVADILNENKPIDIKLLDFIHMRKTSALIEAAFVVGAILAKKDSETVDNFREIGRRIGLAFQIQDDILDVSGTEEELGKHVGSDEKNSKYTYVTLMGMDRAKEVVEEKLDEALDLLNEMEGNKKDFLMDFIGYLKTRRI